MVAQQTFLDEDIDSLFALHPQTCADCGQSFESSRRSSRCAMCTALRGGEVGPATVQCPACGVEHQIPVMAPTKLCGPCRVDPELTLANARDRYDDAFANAQVATARMIDAYNAATFDDQARYDAAQEKRKGWAAHRWQAAYTAAVAKQDGLAPLLIARDACDRATAALEAAQAVLRAVEEYCNDVA